MNRHTVKASSTQITHVVTGSIKNEEVVYFRILLLTNGLIIRSFSLISTSQIIISHPFFLSFSALFSATKNTIIRSSSPTRSATPLRRWHYSLYVTSIYLMEEGDALLPSRQDRIRKHNKFHLLAFSFQIWNGIILRFLNPFIFIYVYLINTKMIVFLYMYTKAVFAVQ